MRRVDFQILVRPMQAALIVSPIRGAANRKRSTTDALCELPAPERKINDRPVR